MLLDQLTKAVMGSLYAGVTPIIEGPPGIGKSAVGRNIARAISGRSFFVYLSQKESTEVAGIPVISKQTKTLNGREVTVVEQAPPDYAVETVQSKKPVLIVFDELSCVPPPTQAPVMSTISDYTLGDLALDPENVGIMACANPSEQAAGGWKLAPPMSNRLAWLPYTPDPVDWAEHFPGYWEQPPSIRRWGKSLDEAMWVKNRAIVAAFIRQQPDQLIGEPKSGAWNSPRTWDYVSRFLTIAQRDNLSPEVEQALVIGAVGEGPGLQFLTMKELQDLPDPYQLLNDPSSFEIPMESTKLYYVVMSMTTESASRIERTEEKKNKDKALLTAAQNGWRNAWTVLFHVLDEGGPVDIATIGAGMLARRMPKGVAPPKGIDRFPDILMKAGLDWSDRDVH